MRFRNFIALSIIATSILFFAGSTLFAVQANHDTHTICPFGIINYNNCPQADAGKGSPTHHVEALRGLSQAITVEHFVLLAVSIFVLAVWNILRRALTPKLATTKIKFMLRFLRDIYSRTIERFFNWFTLQKQLDN